MALGGELVMTLVDVRRQARSRDVPIYNPLHLHPFMTSDRDPARTLCVTCWGWRDDPRHAKHWGWDTT